MAENTVTAEQLVKLLKRYPGNRGAQTKELFYKNIDFVEAMSTKIGEEILNDAINIHEELLNKIANLSATQEESMEYAAVHKIIKKWATKIAFHNKIMAEITSDERTI